MIETTCGKIILIGEHSVIYGHDAIAMPFHQVQSHCVISEISGNIQFISNDFNGPLHQFSNFSFFKAVEAALNYLNRPMKDIQITLHSSIPIASGLGSSASIACSIIKAIFKYFNEPIDTSTLFQLSLISEKVAHQNPSGIDCLVCSTQQAVLFNQHAYQFFDFKCDAYLIIVDSGEQGETKHAIQTVKNHFSQSKMLQLAQLTTQLKHHLLHNNPTQIGNIFNQAHAILKSFGLSTPKIEHLISICNQFALGSKISGAGLGGIVISISDSFEKAKALEDKLLKEGAEHVWIQKMQ